MAYDSVESPGMVICSIQMNSGMWKMYFVREHDIFYEPTAQLIRIIDVTH